MNSVNRRIGSGTVFLNRAGGLSLILFFLLAGAGVRAQAITEGFDNITTLPASGWVMRNNSLPLGSTGWTQGVPNVFPSQAGAPDSYIRANFTNTSDTGTISNWLLTPQLTITNSGVLKFWTRTVTGSAFPDRLEIRLSTNGASTDVGTTPTSVGDFTTVMLSINPNLELGGYPETWTQYTINFSGIPNGSVNGRIGFRYFVTSGGPTGDNSNYIGIDTFSYVPLTGDNFPDAAFDYDGDNKTDYVVVRNTGGGLGGQVTWFINNGTTHTQIPWGISTDTFVGGDFDGDAKTDITVWRRVTGGDSYFHTLRSASGTFASHQLGSSGDDPTVSGDYDGDGKDDYAVYRRGSAGPQQSFWYYLGSTTPNGSVTAVQYGQFGDTPAPGDYDGDGRNDFCVRRGNGSGQAVFLLRKSAGGAEAVVWGLPDDLIVPGDYDGDGKDDFAVARAASGQIIWNVLGRNGNNIIHYGQPWGLSANDFPTQGDYDGDGRTDLAVWRPNNDSGQNFFYVRLSSTIALRAVEWGQQGDYPVAYSNTH